MPNVCTCVCVWLSGWGCCFPSVRSTLHLPRALCDRPTYITTPSTSVSLLSPSSSSLFPLSHPPSIQRSSQPLFTCSVSRAPLFLASPFFHLPTTPCSSRQVSPSIIYIDDASSLPVPYFIYHPALSAIGCLPVLLATTLKNYFLELLMVDSVIILAPFPLTSGLGCPPYTHIVCIKSY